jgi:hypothetical protein
MQIPLFIECSLTEGYYTYAFSADRRMGMTTFAAFSPFVCAARDTQLFAAVPLQNENHSP